MISHHNIVDLEQWWGTTALVKYLISKNLATCLLTKHLKALANCAIISAFLVPEGMLGFFKLVHYLITKSTVGIQIPDKSGFE